MVYGKIPHTWLLVLVSSLKSMNYGDEDIMKLPSCGIIESDIFSLPVPGSAVCNKFERFAVLRHIV